MKNFVIAVMSVNVLTGEEVCEEICMTEAEVPAAKAHAEINSGIETTFYTKRIYLD